MDFKLSFELGMPLLGRCNLSENALLKVIGNDRWKQIQELGGVKTSLIRDDAGSRLYATFYFIEINLTPERPLSSFGENDIVVGIGPVEGVNELTTHHVREGIELVRTLEGDRRNAVGDEIVDLRVMSGRIRAVTAARRC